MANDMEWSSEPLPSLHTINQTPHKTSSRKHSSLRFADTRTSTWVQDVCDATMSARSETPSDEGPLGESAYDFIDTDEESRDDNATESVASMDLGRPYDVASLADTEQSEEESGDEDQENSAAIPTFPGLDHPADTPTIGRSSAVLLEDVEKHLTQSIEFEEPFSLGAENVSVKHTVEDFNEDETAEIIQAMAMQSPPKRLVLTIRQTMAKQGLLTKDPLRILYIGSHSAKQDIIRKIASSVTASVESGRRTQGFRTSASQLYNVVPVSEFGSEQTPEIELMHSSRYQINVEDCISAQSLRFEDVPEKPDVIKLNLEDNFSYHSVPEDQGFIVEPQWELPHVAVFYCFDGDDIEARRTRTITRKFLNRHGVPSIVISHKKLLDRTHCVSLDQHSIHMCLESRDASGRGNIIHQRLPIDLESFLNIDARQMNRNLAYLTGLHENLEVSKPPTTAEKNDIPLANPEDLEKTSYSVSDSVSFIRGRNGAAWRALLPVGFLLLSVFAAVLTGVPSYRSGSTPAISINSKAMSVMPFSTESFTAADSVASLTSTATSMDIKTSTHTITITEAKSPGPNSLSVLSSMDIGNMPPSKSNIQNPLNKSTVCGAEVLGDREILIRIPSATKLSWLSKEAMSVNITRGNLTVDFERIYSSDDGLVLSLAKNEAYGVLNISIITTKKPRVNETFQVDFGTNTYQTMQMVWGRLSSLLPEEKQINYSMEITRQTLGQLRKAVENMVHKARNNSQFTQGHLEDAERAATLFGSRMTDVAKSVSFQAAKRSAILSKELGIQISEAEAKVSKRMQFLKHLREPIDNGLLMAQVRSKLLWLKMQGKQEEHDDYKKRAKLATRRRAEALKNSRRAASDQQKKAHRVAKKTAKREARAKKDLHA